MSEVNTLLFGLLFIILAVFAYFYQKRNSRLFKRMNDFEKKVDNAYKVFHSHFKTTDDTILDLRKERDELKEKLKENHKRKSP